MKEKLVARYERKSTLWKNANAFYVAQDWVKMECFIVDYSKEINYTREHTKMIDKDGNDVTEQFIERAYGKPFSIRMTNSRGRSKGWSFSTREEANDFVRQILRDKILGNFKRIKEDTK